MIDFWLTTAITTLSAGMFVYWFRYTCVLILSAQTARDYARPFALANQLSFFDVQTKLGQSAFAEFDNLKALLERDYQIVARLLEASNSINDGRVENMMLRIDYRLMHAWYGLSSRFSNGMAYRALNEMANVIAHLANAMGEQAAVGA